jgi:hypothetical protein
VITLYDGSGEIILNLETEEDNAGNQIAQVLFAQQPQDKPFTSSRIEHADLHGNWTLKTLFERNPGTQVDQPVARLRRSIGITSNGSAQ